MTRRLFTIAAVLTLSASLASAGQRGQRWPDRSSGGNSSGQSSGGQAALAPAPAPAPRAESRSAPPPPPRQEASPRSEAPRPSQPSGGSQIQRWGAPRTAERAEPAPPPTSAPAPPSGGSQLQRWGIPRQERQEATQPRNEPQPRPAFGLSRGAVPRNQTDQPATAAPPVQTLPQTVQTLPQTVQPLPQTVITGGGSAINRSAAPDGGQRVAQPRQRYPRPEDQQQAAGVAVPRGSANPPQRPGSSDGRSVVYGGRPSTRVYNNYYYYPRHNYPYGFGTYGLGYFYYDPYAWYDNSYYYADPYPAYSYPSYGGGVYQYHSGYPTGELRLQVRPRFAEVYIDGYYAGRVDDFDGYFQGLRIEEGPHTIEIVAAGYETLVFNVRIIAGRKIDYRADLRVYRP